MANNPVTEIDIRTSQAQRNLDQLRQAFDSAGKSTKGLDDALTSQNQTYLKLASATDSAAKARLQYESLERRAGAALDANKISAEQYSKVLDAQTEKLRKIAEGQNQMANSAKSAGESLQGIGAQFGRFAGYAAAVYGVYQAFNAAKEAIAAAGDQVNSLTVRANLATEKLLGGGQSFGEIARIAQAVGSPLEATASLFARIGRSAEEAGLTSVSQVARATEIVSKLGIASGASTQEASAAALQLGQALASGRLQGDELRSILENMPSLGQAIAKEFNVGVGQLRDMGAAGELVSDRVLKGILAAGQDADRQFAALPKTVERASQEMSNAWTIFLAQLDKSLGVSKGIVAAMERARGLAEGATKLVAPATPEEQLAKEREKLRVLDANQPISQSRFDKAENDKTRTEILQRVLELENQIGAAAVVADADDARRVEGQKARRDDFVASETKRIADQITAATARYSQDSAAVARKDAYDKAASEARLKYASLEQGQREALMKLAEYAAVKELGLKGAMEDREKARDAAARAAEKAANDAARQAEKNAQESEKAAAKEQEARDKALETVSEQIDRLNDEAAAIGVGARERAVLAERLKAEQVLKKGLVDIDQELYQGELKRVELAAGQKFDSEQASRSAEKAAEAARRSAEKQAEEAERPWAKAFDYIQQAGGSMFDKLLSGAKGFGDVARDLARRVAAEFASAAIIRPSVQWLGTQLGVGGKNFDANATGSVLAGGAPGTSSGGGFGMPSFGGGGFSGLTNTIDSFGASLGFSAAPQAVGGWTVTGIGGPSVAGLNAGAGGAFGASTLSEVLPFAGVGIGALTQFAQGNVGGGLGTLGGAGIGFALGGPIGMGIGSALGGMLGGAFGGKNPSVGPGGGLQFGVGSDGKIVTGITNQDNGYDPIAANKDAAQTVADATSKVIERLGGKLTGTQRDGWGGLLGYDAGKKQYVGGSNDQDAKRFNTIEEAMTAAVVGLAKNATTTGLGKDITERLGKVASQQDLDNLIGYVDGLKAVKDAFEGWKEPVTQAETAMAGLKNAFEAAKTAAENLGQGTDKVKESYEKQRLYLVQDFNRPLEERYLRATNQNQKADELIRGREEAQLRAAAAALGTEAVLQVEKTLAAERDRDARASLEQQVAAMDQARQARVSAAAEAVQTAMNNIASALESTLKSWQGVAESVAKFNASLGLSSVSPLSPEDQLGLARSQYQDLLGKAMGGDVNAAQGVTSAAQTLLERGRGYYASSAGYADLYNQVTGDLSGLANFAGGAAQTQASAAARAQIDAMRGPSAPAVSDQDKIANAYQDYWGRAAAPAEIKVWTDLIAKGQTNAEQVAASLMYAPQSLVAGNGLGARRLREFAGGGMTDAGEMVRVHPNELLYTGPQTRVFNAREADQIFSGGDNGAIRELIPLLETLIRVTAAAGQANAETQAQMAEALEALRRKANLAASAPAMAA